MNLRIWFIKMAINLLVEKSKKQKTTCSFCTGRRCDGTLVFYQFPNTPHPHGALGNFFFYCRNKRHIVSTYYVPFIFDDSSGSRNT